MLNFKFFLSEAVSDESKLTHLEHAEDHVINSGDRGFAHAYHTLNDVSDRMKGKHNKTTLTTKYDGSPSIVWGYHPETGHFFVGTKSVFNKTPLINHTEKDIDRNHGKSPGLASKLKLALRHLPKITPKGMVLQGDLMHTGSNISKNTSGDVEERDSKYHFKPNTITYSTRTGSEEGKKISKSKLGVVPHTEYTGNNLTRLKANYNADISKLRHHPDVHVISPHYDFNPKHYSQEERDEFNSHMENATKAFNKASKDFHTIISKHASHLKKYVNKTVKQGTSPTLEGYTQHLTDHYDKEASKVKTDKAKKAKADILADHHSDVNTYKKHFNSTLDMHSSLQRAKDVLVKSLSKKSKFDHHIGGIKTKPEGFVVVRGNRPSKLVDRSDFSRANFLSRER